MAAPVVGLVAARLVLALLVVSVRWLSAFNVNEDRAAVYTAGAQWGTGRPHVGAMFGFSVSQHVDSRGNKRILVGAPRANTTQPGINEGGAVYNCELVRTSSINCGIMVFDRTGNQEKSQAHIGRPDELYEQKSGQWFGATVVSARNRSTGAALACAPRYQYFSVNTDKRLPIGICYYYNGISNSVTTLDPLKENVDNQTRRMDGALEQMYYWGKGQYGISAAIHQAGTTMMVGVPGSFSWSGRFLVHTSKDPRHPKRSGGPNYFVKKNNYFGYSVAFGNFSLSADLDFVVGAPRGGTELSFGPGTLCGTIRVLKLNDAAGDGPRIKMVHDLFAGDQMGQYLGYSLAVGDFNGDGLDDIAAGAPFYSGWGSYNTGRVLILRQTKLGIINRAHHQYLEGFQRPGEMFGISLAVIGDINQDGFTDLAVGAPYGGTAGHGAVYIFHGSSRGLKPKVSQMIDAVTVSGHLRTFGFSISAGLDMDSNGYPDLTVGAYETGSIVQLWTHPVIRLYLNVTVPPTVSLADTSGPDKDPNPSQFLVKIHHWHKGNKPQTNMKLSVMVRLDADRNAAPRAYFRNGTRRTPAYQTEMAIFNEEGESSFILPVAYIKSGVRDKLSPIIVEVQYHVTSDDFNQLAPLFDVRIPTTLRSEITIDKNCGPDRTCIADLRLSAEAMTAAFVLGKETIDVNVSVENLEPDGAFEATVTATLPPGTLYAKVYNIKAPVTVRCSPAQTQEEAETGSEVTETEQVICEIGNPLPGHGKVEFTLRLDTKNFDGSIEHLTFSLNASSSNPENATTTDNNQVDVLVPVRALTPLRISGTSNPDQIIFAPDDATNQKAGKPTTTNRITHIYEVQNLGPSTVQTANVTVFWPSRFPAQDELGDLFVIKSAIVKQGQKTTNCNIIDLSPPVQENITSQAPASTRRRRATQTFTEKLFSADKFNKKVVCSPGGVQLWCSTIRCRVGRLRPDERALVRIEAQLSPASLRQMPHMTILVTSEGVAVVDSLPYVGNFELGSETDPVAVDTVLATKGPGQTFQWWIIAVAVFSGILLLAVLIIALYKCGFFKRKQYGDDDAILNSVDQDDDDDDEAEDEAAMFARFAEGEAGNRNSRIDTVNRKLILQNGISLSIEEKR